MLQGCEGGYAEGSHIIYVTISHHGDDSIYLDWVRVIFDDYTYSQCGGTDMLLYGDEYYTNGCS
jgi:hypothetical protein